MNMIWLANDRLKSATELLLMCRFSFLLTEKWMSFSWNECFVQKQSNFSAQWVEFECTSTSNLTHSVKRAINKSKVCSALCCGKYSSFIVFNVSMHLSIPGLLVGCHTNHCRWTSQLGFWRNPIRTASSFNTNIEMFYSNRWMGYIKVLFFYSSAQ